MTVASLGFRKESVCLMQVPILQFRVMETGGQRGRLEVEAGASAWSGSGRTRKESARGAQGERGTRRGALGIRRR